MYNERIIAPLIFKIIWMRIKEFFLVWPKYDLSGDIRPISFHLMKNFKKMTYSWLISILIILIFKDLFK